MADLNLNELRKVAEAATPGPWLRNPDDDCEVLAEDYDPMFPDFPFEFVITDCNGKASVSEPNFAHIIAFHPPTVLALLDRLEAAEAEVGRLRLDRAEFADQNEALRSRIDRAREIEDARLMEAVAAVTPCACNAQRERAKKAEAVIARVETLAVEWSFPVSLSHDDHWYASRLHAALAGESDE